MIHKKHEKIVCEKISSSDVGVVNASVVHSVIEADVKVVEEVGGAVGAKVEVEVEVEVEVVADKVDVEIVGSGDMVGGVSEERIYGYQLLVVILESFL